MTPDDAAQAPPGGGPPPLYINSSRDNLDDVHVLPTSLAVPGVGNIIINSYILLAEQPVLVDAGIAADGDDDFLDALRAVVDPADQRWTG